VVALGGTIHIRRKGEAEDRLVKTAAELPADDFQVTRACLAGVQKPLGDLLPRLAALTDSDFDRFRVLDLSGTAADDGNLNALRPLTGLTELSLAGTKVSDAGLADLKSLKHLRHLVLDGCAIRGTGLASLKDLPALTDLRLACPTLTDEGLKALHGLNGLKELNLTGTQVTAAGVAMLQKALPKCKIIWDSPDRKAAE
jgi:hypothetical protein